MPLIRLAYASEASFTAQPLEQGIEPNVARILLTSRRNNPKRGLVGGLYYGDSYFFQYLEGEEWAVRQMYENIQADSRHRHVKTLIEEPLDAHTFSNWSMKYVPVAGDVAQFLRQHRLSKFDPYGFDRDLCEQMIALIRASSHDDRLVNYGTTPSRDTHTGPVSRGVRNGLILAGVVLIAAVAVGGTLLL